MELRNRDLLILLVSICAILLGLQLEGEFLLRLRWRLQLSTHFYENGHFPTLSERLPKPIISDLNGDGKNEVILATRDPEIQIHHFEEGTSQNPQGRLSLVLKKSLLLETRVGSRRHPVSIGVGYLDLLEGDGPREQYIVVLTQGWDVICFDSQLKPLWEVSVDKEVPQNYFIRESAVLVAPGGVSSSSGTGLVVVGGRLAKLEDKQAHNVGHEHEKRVSGEKLGEEVEEGEAIPAAPEVPDHFSYYAFEGKTGRMLWSHQASDFLHQNTGPIEEGEYMQSHYKVDARIPLKHEGEVNWKRFRNSIADVLPHRWQSQEDTSLSLASFHKNKKRTAGQKYHQEVTGITWSGEDIFSSSKDPVSLVNNVVVAKLHDGIEVLQLHSGQTLCRVPMGGDIHGNNGAYADLNGDGVIDHIMAVAGKSTKNPNKSLGKAGKAAVCYTKATSGIPPISPLFNGSLCNRGGAVDEFFLNAAHYLDEGMAIMDNSGDEVQALDPLLVPSKVRLTSLRSHSRYFDSVFLVSNGKVTSYSSAGTLNWQVETGSGWSKAVQKSVKFASADQAISMLDFVETAFYPSLQVLSLNELDDQQKRIVAIGWHKMTILNLQGTILHEMELPEPPIASPAFGDFDNDGSNDILFISRTGIYGISVEHKRGSAFFSYLVYLLVCLLLAIFVRKTTLQSKEDKGRGLTRGTD